MTTIVDLWAESRGGELIAVVLLSPAHWLRCSDRPLGWVSSSLDLVARLVPRVVLLPWHQLPSLDHAAVSRQVQAQMA